MGLRDWLRKALGRQPRRETVPFLDVEAGRVVQIPASELAPGAVQARIQGSDELVWVLPEQLKESDVQHPPFDEEIREYIRQIQSAFAEQRPLSFEEWEDGFRRDADPMREIALWSHAADVYTELVTDEQDASRRRDIYQCVVACLTTGPDTVWQVLRPEALSRPEAERAVNRFFGKSG